MSDGHTTRALRLSAMIAFLGLLLALPASRLASALAAAGGAKPTVVLVHGAWADGSSWREVVSRLQSKGYEVRVPPNPLRGPSTDAPYLASFLSSVPGPIVLVGHSYGGFVITNAATGNPNVKALVYIDAFMPAAGQSQADLTAGSCLNDDPTKSFHAVPSPGAVELYLNIAPNPPYIGFGECLANGVNKADAKVLGASQRPLAAAGLLQPSGPPAWATIPAWALIGTEDRAIPTVNQLQMAAVAGAAVQTVKAGHLSLITKPEAVTKIILDAITATD